MSDDRPAPLTHPSVRSARRLRRHRERVATGRLLVEGPHAVDEAVDHLVGAFVTERPSARAGSVVDRCREAGAPVLTVTERALAALADARTPQGIVGVARWPRTDLSVLRTATLVVVLDQVADPGNLGTVVRAADAAGADGVVLTTGSVDPTNAKAVRASSGSMFHLPVVDDVTPEEVATHARAFGLLLVAADAGASQRYDDMSFDDPTAIVFGNETHGLSPAMRHLVGRSVSVPIMRPERPGYRGHAESLNLATAAAVVMFEIARQRAGPDRTGSDGRRARQPAP